MDACDRAEDAEDEDQAGGVEAGHQLGERGEAADAVLRDGDHHRAHRSERRELHDHRDDAEHDVAAAVDQVAERGAAVADLVQRDADEDRDEQDRQDVIAAEVRNDVEHEARLRVRADVAGYRLCIGRSERFVEPHSR